MSAQTLDIVKLGGQGDGIAETAEGQVFVPFTLPGDRITAAVDKGRGTLMAVLTPSADRAEPPCPHFGPDSDDAQCGGCALQHMAEDVYRDWKRGLVVSALESRGIMAEVGALVGGAPQTRRRVVFAARRTESGCGAGLQQAPKATRSCRSRPAWWRPQRINAGAAGAHPHGGRAWPSSREAFRVTVAGDRGRASTLPAEAPFRLSETDRLQDHRLCDPQGGGHRAAELQWRAADRKAAAAADIRRPSTVNPPPGGFVQASEAAEALMVDLVGSASEERPSGWRICSPAPGTFTLQAGSPTAMCMRWRARKLAACRARQGGAARAGPQAGERGAARPVPPAADDVRAEDPIRGWPSTRRARAPKAQAQRDRPLRR
jgi:23S rRNA (uracil1939-C5)-methyltransferase